MRTALKGRFGNKPELKEVTSKKGEKFKTTSFSLYIADPKSRDENGHMIDTPFQCTAFGDNAEKICEIAEKGNELCGVAEMRADHWEDKDGHAHKDMRWNFTAVDPEMKIANQQTKILTAFSKGDIENLTDGVNPEKAAAKNEQTKAKEPEAEKAAPFREPEV